MRNPRAHQISIIPSLIMMLMALAGAAILAVDRPAPAPTVMAEAPEHLLLATR